MLPRYGEWHERLTTRGLAVVGVHTPELEHERDPNRLREFVRKNRIDWAVLIDPEYAVWNRYGIEAWPTIVLIDRKGVIRSVFVGDSQSRAIEAALAELLAEGL
jgi:peroxiredoxin